MFEVWEKYANKWILDFPDSCFYKKICIMPKNSNNLHVYVEQLAPCL